MVMVMVMVMVVRVEGRGSVCEVGRVTVWIVRVERLYNNNCMEYKLLLVFLLTPAPFLQPSLCLATHGT